MLEKDENGNCIGKCAGCENAYQVFSPFELCPTGSVTSGSDKIIRKTGRHFSQVEELLKAMKEK